MKKYILLLSVFILSVSCAKEENRADNFVGKQEVTITLDNHEPLTFYSGEYYDSENMTNADIARIIVSPSDREFKFTIRDTEIFDIFSFSYEDTFASSITEITAGIVTENPYFFSSYMEFTEDYLISDTSTSNELDLAAIFNNGAYVNTGIFGSDSPYGTLSTLTLEVTDMYSNGVEKYIDGVRKDYPLEMIEGSLNIEFMDEEDQFHTLKMDFYLEGDDIVKERTEDITTDDGDNGLIGKWTQVGACLNSSGNGNSFTFSSGGSGNVFQADCNNACSGGGVRTNFNYSVDGSSVTITPTSVSDYCGVASNTPSPFTVSWSVSGDILTLDGQDFKKD